jgi:hypothetical protein
MQLDKIGTSESGSSNSCFVVVFAVNAPDGSGRCELALALASANTSQTNSPLYCALAIGHLDQNPKSNKAQKKTDSKCNL